MAGTTGQPDKKGFDYSFGFLDHRHAHRQYTDHLYRNAERVAGRYQPRLRQRPLHPRGRVVHHACRTPKPFFIYLNYTVPHAELRAPEDSLAPLKGRFLPETPFVNAAADGRQTGATPDGASLGYRSQPTPHAAFVAMITRMDRDIARLTDLLGERKIDRNTLIMFVSDNGPHREGGADPDFFRSSGGLRGIKRDLYEGGIRVPMVARWVGTIPAGPRELSRVGALGHAADADRARRREDARRDRRHVDGARAQGTAAADAGVHVLGVPRARLPAGRAHGALEGGAAQEGRPARALRSARTIPTSSTMSRRPTRTSSPRSKST